MKPTRESQFLKQARKDAGLTQNYIAKKLGYGSAQFLSNCERSLCSLPPTAMKRFCKLTNTDVKFYIHCKVQDYKQYLIEVTNAKGG